MLPACARLSVFLLVAGAVACSSKTDAPEAGGRTPARVRSVLLVTIDTLRADHLSSYGYPRGTSPNLDAFMARGVRFEHAFSTSPVTLPSHISILAGRTPSFTTVGVKNGPRILEPSVTTIAERCVEGGIRTAAIVSNFVLRRKLALDQGFESYDDQLPDREIVRNLPERVAEHAVEGAIARLERLAGERFFLWLHLQDPHGPYLPPDGVPPGYRDDPPGLGEDRRLPLGRNQGGYKEIPAYQGVGDERWASDYVNRYDAEIAYLDGWMRSLFEYLERSGRLSDTLVILTSDHGEAMGENDYYFAHGHAVSPDQTRVPLAFVGPGIPTGRVVARAVSNVSIYATVLNALGLDDRARIEQSDSLWEALTSAEEPPVRVGFAESATQRAAFAGTTYLHRDEVFEGAPLPFGVPDPESGVVYESVGVRTLTLDGDPQPDAPDAAQVRDALDRYSEAAQRARRSVAARTFTLTEEEKRALRALGYLPEEE